MKLFTTSEGIARAEGDALDLLDLPQPDLGALLEVDRALDTARAAAVTRRLATGEATLRAPVPRPGKIVCIGINYASHVEEMRPVMERIGAELPVDPVFFVVPGSAVIGPEEPVVLPSIAPDRVDYEVELAAVIGRGGREIGEGAALDHVAGFTLCNDVSARDVQGKAMTGQEFTLAHAKGMDGFKPLGPCLVTADEFRDPLDVRVQARVNGELRQDASTLDFVHPLPRVIAHVSRYMRLDPGDVIATGSPSGVGFFRGVFLKPGDVVELSADGIGTLRSPVLAAEGAP